MRIYLKGELIKTHEHLSEGKRSTDYTDYPKELSPYAMRDPERIIQEAHRQGKHLGLFMGPPRAPALPARQRVARAVTVLAAPASPTDSPGEAGSFRGGWRRTLRSAPPGRGFGTPTRHRRRE